MRFNALAATLFVLAAASVAAAQGSIGGQHQYPQFRVFSGLPGGGYGVLPDGTPDVNGAAALATPIAYSLGSHVAASLFNTGDDLDPFRFDRGGRAETGNGSAAITVGSSFLHGYHASIGVFFLSTHLDTVFNAQISSPQLGRVGVAVGVQDLHNDGGSAGTGSQYDGESSRSIYGVATYDCGHHIYASAGIGDHRFDGGFANLSVPLTARLRATTEYDGFNFNSGLLYGTSRLKGLKGKLGEAQGSVFLGLVREKYGTIGVTLTL